MTVDTAIGRKDFPTEFEIPRREIAPQEILNRLEKNASSVQILVDPNGAKISLPEELAAKVEPKNQKAEAFVLYGKSMEGLTGLM